MMSTTKEQTLERRISLPGTEELMRSGSSGSLAYYEAPIVAADNTTALDFEIWEVGETDPRQYETVVISPLEIDHIRMDYIPTPTNIAEELKVLAPDDNALKAILKVRPRQESEPHKQYLIFRVKRNYSTLRPV